MALPLDTRLCPVKKAVYKSLLGGVLLVVAAVALTQLLSASHKQLVACMAQLRANGEKVTFEELAATLSHVTQGALADFTNIVFELGVPPSGDLDPATPPYVGAGRARVRSGQKVPPVAATNGMTNGSWSDWNSRLAASAPRLRELRRYLEKPPPNVGPWTNYFAHPIAWRENRSAVRWLVCDALACLHDRQRDAALADIEAIAGLANLHREEFNMAIQMTRVAVAGAGFDLTWEALQLDGWNDGQLAALQRCWETQDFLSGLETAMQGERCVGLELLAQWRDGRLGRTSGVRSGWDSVRVSRILHHRILENDVTFHLRHLHAQVEIARQLRSGLSLSNAEKRFRELDDRIERKGESATRVFYLISLIATPKFEKAFVRAAQIETHRRLTVAAIALRRCQLRRGQAPTNLAALVPEFLGAIPNDGMDGRPLKYRLNQDGTFTLYSVGQNGIDDGGDAAPSQPGLPSMGGDLWAGRDAVWPAAVWDQSATILRSSTQ
jgi:hypothetical protein